MHDNKELHVINTEQKLLFDIRQLLIEQNELLKSFNINKVEDNKTSLSLVKKGGKK